MSTWGKANLILIFISFPLLACTSILSLYMGYECLSEKKHPTAVTDVKSSLCQKSGSSIYTVLFLHRCYFLSYLGLKCSLFKMLDMKGWLLLYLGLKALQRQLLESTVPYKWTFQKQLNAPLWNKIGARLTHFRDSAGLWLVLCCSCNNAFPFTTTVTVQRSLLGKLYYLSVPSLRLFCC